MEYFRLGIVSLLPAFVSLIFYVLEKRTPFGKLNYAAKQILYGVVFGVLAIMGTEFGIPINNARMNCRDAAVLSAGLFFGSPAGIIAGLIGGLERWFSVYWGVDGFTRLACSLSTIIAGVYAALLRKFMFENKKPGVLISLATGIVMEVFHMTMVFITNMGSPEQAMDVVKKCTPIMVPANGISVMFGAFLVSLLSKKNRSKEGRGTRVSQTIQRWLLVTVIFAFVVTTLFVFSYQDKMADSQADSFLSLAVDETSADISDASDENLLNVTKQAANDLMSEELDSVSKKYGLAEINILSGDGTVVDSTEKRKVGSQAADWQNIIKELNKSGEYACDYDETVSRKYAAISAENGIIQVGYDAEAFQRDIDNQVVGITKNRHVGKTGYVMILDGHLNIISAPAELKQKNLAQASKSVDMPDENITFNLEINGVDSRCRYQLTEGYYIFSVLPEAEAVQMRNIALYINTFLEILVFAVLFALIYLLIKLVVVNQIKKINVSLSKIAGGNLNEAVDVRSSEEFASLSDDINSTVDTLKEYIAEASARIDKELEFAKNIQRSALPASFPASNTRHDFDIFATMDPAKEVGGDFYDFYLTGRDTVNFLVADVSGKGIPAAMFMMRAKTELKSLTEASLSIDNVFTQGNADLCEGNDAGMFVTAWQGSLNLTDGVVKFANAGHNPPLVRRSSGKFEYLKTRAGFVLAGMEGIKYREQELKLEPGDVIYLYTDGVTEATNSENELYGEEKLLNILNSLSCKTMEELCAAVKSDVDAFVGEAPQFDDITMLALRYNGTLTMSFEKATLDDIPAVTEFVEAQLEKLDCPMKTVVQINIAIDELMSNIIKYGYPDGPGKLTVKFIERDNPHCVYIRLEDEGIPYNPLTKEDPDVTLSAEERSIGGLGIYMVKKTMDDVKYKYEDEKNIITIRKNI